MKRWGEYYERWGIIPCEASRPGHYNTWCAVRQPLRAELWNWHYITGKPNYVRVKKYRGNVKKHIVFSSRQLLLGKMKQSELKYCTFISSEISQLSPLLCVPKFKTRSSQAAKNRVSEVHFQFQLLWTVIQISKWMHASHFHVQARHMFLIYSIPYRCLRTKVFSVQFQPSP